jgi:hypothetical protein
MESSNSSRFDITPIESPITECAFLLAALKDDKVLAAGTAIAVGRELLITATHVLDHMWQSIEYSTPPGADQTKQSTFVGVAIHWPRGASGAAIWIIESATKCAGDIACKVGQDLVESRLVTGHERLTWEFS